MAGFKRANPQQAALKMSIYGPPGSGKTFTALLVAEGLAAATRKRIAYVDTERGTDFYVQRVPARRAHPEAFDLDALYTRSIAEVLSAVKALDPREHGVLVIDSMTHVWEAAIAAYAGKTTKAGAIPMWAWGGIKKPYKELMSWCINSPLHVLILGRQGVDYVEDENTGEVKAAGWKMKAEGETQYEPHVCLRMEAVRHRKSEEAVPTVYVDKDRSGILQGKVIAYPTFETLAAPLLGLLGKTQAHIPGEEEAAARDIDAFGRAQRARERVSTEFLKDFASKFELASRQGPAAVEAAAKKITPGIKKQMIPPHVEELKDLYRHAMSIAEQAELSEESEAILQEAEEAQQEDFREMLKGTIRNNLPQ